MPMFMHEISDASDRQMENRKNQKVITYKHYRRMLIKEKQEKHLKTLLQSLLSTSKQPMK
jgi:hypothetical protein